MIQGPLSANHRQKIESFIGRMRHTDAQKLASELPGEKESYWLDEQRKIDCYGSDQLNRELPATDNSPSDLNSEKGVVTHETAQTSATTRFEGNSRNGQIVENSLYQGPHGVYETLGAKVFKENAIELFQQTADSNGGQVSGHFIHLDRQNPKNSFMVVLDEQWLLGDTKHTTIAAAQVDGPISNENRAAKQVKDRVTELAARAADWDQSGSDGDKTPGSVSVSDKRIPLSLSEAKNLLDDVLEGGVGEALGAAGKLVGKTLVGDGRVTGTARFGEDGTLTSLDMSRKRGDDLSKGSYFYQLQPDGSTIYAGPDALGVQRVVKEEAGGQLFVATTDKSVTEFLQTTDWKVTGV